MQNIKVSGTLYICIIWWKKDLDLDSVESAGGCFCKTLTINKKHMLFCFLCKSFDVFKTFFSVKNMICLEVVSETLHFSLDILLKSIKQQSIVKHNIVYLLNRRHKFMARPLISMNEKENEKSIKWPRFLLIFRLKGKLA